MYLTDRQRAVAEQLLQGCSNREIGLKIGIEERTVKAHLSKMFLMFGIKDGDRRIRLAVHLHRRLAACHALEEIQIEKQLVASLEESGSLPKTSKLSTASTTDSPAQKSENKLEALPWWLRITSPEFTTKSESSPNSNSPSGLRGDLITLTRRYLDLEARISKMEDQWQHLSALFAEVLSRPPLPTANCSANVENAEDETSD